ncbi:MAG TPA: hypothetical protein VHL78_10360 [Actinomycetota bacterium]|nr:hypothetical protein [Actinomycetota bacterium]
MSNRFLSHLRTPSPSTVIAILALVLALSGGAIAKDKLNKDEVTHLTITGGPVTSVDPDDGAAEIPLSTETYTQKAGEVLLVSAFADITGVPQGEATCDLSVVLEGQSPDPGWNFGIYDMFQLARRGDGGDRIGDTVLPAPETDQLITLTARAHEEDFGELSEEGDCTDDTFTVSLRATLTTLRN